MCEECRSNDRLLVLKKYDSESDYFKNDVSDIFDELYLNVICILSDDGNPICKQHEAPQPVITNNSAINDIRNDKTPSTRLCKILIPSFEGSYIESLSRYVFIVSIH